MMNLIEPVLYIDLQGKVPVGYCARCGAEIYHRWSPCTRCGGSGL